MKDEAIDALVAVRDELRAPRRGGGRVSASAAARAGFVGATLGLVSRSPSARRHATDPGRVRARAGRDRARRHHPRGRVPRGPAQAVRLRACAAASAARAMRPPELVRTEREITLGMASAGTCTSGCCRSCARPPPSASPPGTASTRTPPDPARRLLGDDAWHLLRPDRRSRRTPTGLASRSGGCAGSSTRWSASDAARRAADPGGADPSTRSSAPSSASATRSS